MKAICGLECDSCEMRESCGGCGETGGRPFGGSCMLALCCEREGCASCGKAFEAPCKLREELIAEFNALGIEDIEEVTELNALLGSYINLPYTLPGGETVRFWEDNRIYLGNQIRKKNSDRCYGLTADEDYLLVCEYGEGGSDPEIIVYRKRKKLPEEYMFFDTDFLKSDEIQLILEKTVNGDKERNWAPTYHFFISDLNGTKMGVCELRIGYNDKLYFGGHIGYQVYPDYRGNHYAGKACQLLFQLARKHKMEYLYITCNPDNYASRKTCEYAGGKLLEIAELPEGNDMRDSGEFEKCIYKFALGV